MVRFLVSITLILALIAPHQVGAHAGHDLHGGHTSVTHADEAEWHGGHDQKGSQHCCDATLGGCVVAALIHQPADWTSFTQTASVSTIPVATLTDGLAPSFDPPPPRV